MKKIRCFLAAMALVVTLGGTSLQGMGLTANAASSLHAGSSSVVGHLMRSGVAIPDWPCPAAGDC